MRVLQLINVQKTCIEIDFRNSFHWVSGPVRHTRPVACRVFISVYEFNFQTAHLDEFTPELFLIKCFRIIFIALFDGGGDMNASSVEDGRRQ